MIALIYPKIRINGIGITDTAFGLVKSIKLDKKLTKS